MQVLAEITQWMPIVSLIVSCLGIPTIGALIATDIYKKHKENSAQAKERKQAEQKEVFREVIREEIKPVKEDIIQLKNDSDLTKQSLQATLRHELYEIADRWLAKGFCPLQDKEDLENIYKKYHALGKNGVMDDIYAKVMNLPIAKPKPKTRVRYERDHKTNQHTI